MFNTGARVQEIITVRVLDVRLQTPHRQRTPLRFASGAREHPESSCGARARQSELDSRSLAAVS
jgi:hypothetical protein